MSEHLFAWRTTTTARLRDDAEAMGNDLDPVLCAIGPATAHRRPHAIQLLGRLFPTDLPSPAGPTFRLSATELLPFRERVQDGIGMPGAMAAVARPGILARIGHHRGPHRVGLDVPQNDERGLLGRVDLGGCPPRSPTDPDLRLIKPPLSQCLIPDPGRMDIGDQDLKTDNLLHDDVCSADLLERESAMSFHSRRRSRPSAQTTHRPRGGTCRERTQPRIAQMRSLSTGI